MSKPGPEDAPDARTVRFGIKQLKANPADSVRRQFPPKTVVKGKVTEVSDKGVKMSIDEKNIAFCPPSETDPDEIPKVGDQVSGVAYSVDDGSFAVLVSLKRFIEMRDRKKMAQYLKAPPPLRLGQLFGADEKLR
jgi:small subunit ribosomal protein S1